MFSGTYKLFNFICITWHRVQGPLKKKIMYVCAHTSVCDLVCVSLNCRNSQESNLLFHSNKSILRIVG